MIAAEAIAVELAPGLRVEWELERLRSAAGGGRFEERPWRVDGEPSASGFEALRIVSAAFEDGSALALAAARPAGAAGHGEEIVRAALVPPDGEPEQMVEALLSTEYDSSGTVRRAGIELHRGESAYVERVAADRTGRRTGGVEMEFRFAGRRGVGLYEVHDLA